MKCHATVETSAASYTDALFARGAGRAQVKVPLRRRLLRILHESGLRYCDFISAICVVLFKSFFLLLATIREDCSDIECSFSFGSHDDIISF